MIITFSACDGKITTVSSVTGAISQKRPSVPANLQQQRNVIQRRLNVFISAEEERSNEASDSLRLCPSPSFDQLGSPAFMRFSNCCINAGTTTLFSFKMVLEPVLAPKISTYSEFGFRRKIQECYDLIRFFFLLNLLF